MAKVIRLGPFHGGQYQPDYQLLLYRNGNPRKPIPAKQLDLRSVVSIQTSKNLNDLAGTFQIVLKDKRARQVVREMDVIRIRLRGHHSDSLVTVMKGIVDGVRPVGSTDPHGSREDTVIHGRCTGGYLQNTSLFLPVWDPESGLPTALTFGMGDVTQKGSPTYKAGGTTPFDIFQYLVRTYTFAQGRDLVGIGGIPNSRHWLNSRARFARRLFNVPFLQFNQDPVAIALKSMEIIGFTETWVDEIGRIVYRRPQWDSPARYRISTGSLIDWEFPRGAEQVATYVEVIPAGDPGIDSGTAQALRAGRAPVPSSYVKAGKDTTSLGQYVSPEFVIDTDSRGKPTAKGRRNPWYQLQRRLGVRPQTVHAPLLVTQEQAQAHAEGLLRFYSRMTKGMQCTIPGVPELRLGFTIRVDGELEGLPFDRSGYIESVQHSYVETTEGGQYTTTFLATHGRDARDPFTGRPDPKWGKIALPRFNPEDLASDPDGGVAAPAPKGGSPGKAGSLTSPLPGALKVISTVRDHGSRPLGNWQSDNAVDLGAPKGTRIYAVTDGRISSSLGFGPNTGTGGSTVYGSRLHLDAGDNVYFYTHLDRIAPGITPGTEVKAGDLLGYVGEKAGIPSHLHFASQRGNPEKLLGIS